MYSYEHRYKKKTQKIILEKTFSSWWIMLFLGKLCDMWKNIKKKELSSIRTKFSYYNVFHGKIINNIYEKTEIRENNLVCLGLSILELYKILMYEFWYDCV